MRSTLFRILPLAASLCGIASAFPAENLTADAPAETALRAYGTLLEDFVLPNGCKVTVSREPALKVAPLIDGGEVAMVGGDLDGAEGTHTLCNGVQELIIAARHASDGLAANGARHFIETEGAVSYELALLTRMATPEVGTAVLSLPTLTAAVARRRRS